MQRQAEKAAAAHVRGVLEEDSTLSDAGTPMWRTISGGRGCQRGGATSSERRAAWADLGSSKKRYASPCFYPSGVGPAHSAPTYCINRGGDGNTGMIGY